MEARLNWLVCIVIDWYVFGKKRQGSSDSNRDRPLKVQFKSAEERNNFIYRFRKNLPNGYKNDFPGRVPSCRRDMTQMELQLLYKLRQEVYHRNKAAGRIAFYVRDLTICETTRQNNIH